MIKKYSLKEYICANADKFKRAVEGTETGGKLVGGVGKEASDLEKLAAYDKLGGLVTKDGYKVKSGSFYDFVEKKPHQEPQVIFLFKDLSGVMVEILEEEVGKKGLPPEVEAANLIAEKKKDKAKAETARLAAVKKAKRSKAHEVIE